VALPSRAFAAGSSALHAFCERGTGAGFVVLVVDDPACEVTPGEIDSRYLARELYLPILEPGSIEEARAMAREAPRLSQAWGQPVMLRLGMRLMDTRAPVETARAAPAEAPRAPPAPPALPSTPFGAYGGVAARSARITRLDGVRAAVEQLPWNRVELNPPSDLLLVAVGGAWGPARDALQLIGLEKAVHLAKVATPYPLPRTLLSQAMAKAKRAIVIEELEPFVESRVSDIANKEGLSVTVRGKLFFPRGGELTTRDIADGLGRFMGVSPPVDDKRLALIDKIVAQALPERRPSLPPSHGMRQACEAASAYTGDTSRERLIVEAPPEWRIAMGEVSPLYFGDWGEGLGVGAAIARKRGAPTVVVTEGRGVVAGLSALREAEAEKLKLLVVVSPQGLSPAVGRALPGAPHHALDLKALSAALGLEPTTLLDIGPADVPTLAGALAQAAGDKLWPRMVTFQVQPAGEGAP